MADQKFVFVKALLKKYHKWCDEQDAERKASHKRKINRGDIYNFMLYLQSIEQLDLKSLYEAIINKGEK